MNESELDPGRKLFLRSVVQFPAPTPWPTLARLVLELVALLAAGGVLFAWLAMVHK